MKQCIYTASAPEPIGPYSQAVLSGNTLYMSGQIAIDPLNGQLVLESIEAETLQVMRNISALLTEAGMDFSQVVKTTIFLSDMQLFSRVNEVYGSFFDGAYPARETVQVAGLPKNVNVEISVIAVKPS